MLLTDLLLLSCVVLQDAPVKKPTLVVPAFDDEKLALRIDALAKEAVEKEGVPGLSIAVAQQGEVTFSKGYGYADAARALPAKGDTKYPLGSLTRQFTAVSVLQLIDAKKLALDDELSKLLPGFPVGDHKVTLQHMLSNTSGIPGFTKVKKKHEAIAKKSLTEAEFFACFADVPFDFAPGDDFSLDSANYALLSMIVAKVSQEPYADYVKTHLLEPIGLSDTAFCPDAGRPAGFAVDCETLADESEFELPLGRATGITTQSLCSNATDLVPWQQALFERDVFSESASWRIIRPATLPDGNSTRYGYALQMTMFGEYKNYSHTGGSSGSRVRLSFYSLPRLTIVVLANCSTAPVERIEQDIARFILAMPAPKNEEIPLPAEDLARCTGMYQIATTQIRVVAKDGQLWYTPPVQPAVRLCYQGQLTFRFENELDTRITFHAPEGKCEGFTLVRGGLETKAKRVE